MPATANETGVMLDIDCFSDVPLHGHVKEPDAPRATIPGMLLAELYANHDRLPNGRWVMKTP
jgi:hypothetical protein